MRRTHLLNMTAADESCTMNLRSYGSDARFAAFPRWCALSPAISTEEDDLFPPSIATSPRRASAVPRALFAAGRPTRR